MLVDLWSQSRILGFVTASLPRFNLVAVSLVQSSWYLSLVFDPGERQWYLSDCRTGEVVAMPSPGFGSEAWTLRSWPEADSPTYCSIHSGKEALWDLIFSELKSLYCRSVSGHSFAFAFSCRRRVPPRHLVLSIKIWLVV